MLRRSMMELLETLRIRFPLLAAVFCVTISHRWMFNLIRTFFSLLTPQD
jgi:hypothetical protein